MAAIDNNIVSIWRMEGNSNDSFGSNNGSDTAMSYSTPAGKITQGAIFNGTSSKFTVGTPASLALSVFSIAGWMNMTDLVANRALISIRGTGSAYVRVETTGKVALIKDAAVGIALSTGTVATGAYRMVGVTYDVLGNYVFYIDGSAAGSGTNLVAFTNAGTGVIGTESSSGEFMKGNADEIVVWSDVKDGTAMADFYNAGVGKYWNGSAFVAPVGATLAARRALLGVGI